MSTTDDNMESVSFRLINGGQVTIKVYCCKTRIEMVDEFPEESEIKEGRIYVLVDEDNPEEGDSNG